MAFSQALLLCSLVLIGSVSARELIQTSSTTQGPNDIKEVDYNPAHGPPLTLDAFFPKTAMGLEPEQVSVTYWQAPGTYLVSWVTGDAQVGLGLTAPSTKTQKSTVMISTSPDMKDAKQYEGHAVTYKMNYSGYKRYNLLDYISGLIHHTKVDGLTPGTTYYYKVGDSRYSLSKVYNFTAVPNQFPLKISVTADTGQTVNTTQTVEHLLAFSKPDLLLNVGDLSYADNFDSRCTMACWLTAIYDQLSGKPYFVPGGGNLTATCQQAVPPEKMEAPDTYQPKFDSWARLWEQVLAYTPTIQTNGNHEMDIQADGTMFAGYNARYPQPQNPEVINTNPISYFSDKDDDNLYSAATVPGVATIIMLTSFQPFVTFGSDNDNQFKWLKKQLAAVDRKQTPWLLVGFHIPLYTTDPNSWKVSDCFRLAYEPLFYDAGVDVIFSGHVHAYERTFPVYNYTRDDCGFVQIVVGSGGNNEGLSAVPGGWMDQQANTTAFCKNPESRQWPDYQPQRCFSYQTKYAKYANYCPDSQPDWEAYRETGFGSGLFTIISATEAKWEWHSNLAGLHEVSDEVTITRGSDKCSKQ